ncbi:MAG: CCA tRNA nucleotidyltransferase [Desulfuromonadales bacterium]|nr:CCA tRNA nucleotidyltransferase [Desulfuromonadales bacterium]
MGWERLQEILKQARIVPELTGLLEPEAELYLVGGTLRDWLLGRPATDFDFATPGDPTSLAQAYARRVGGHWFMLDPVRDQSRVVVRQDRGALTFDFAPFRAPDLEGDLRLRDFTVNALALRLYRDGRIGTLHDPLAGQSDLGEGSLRACSPGVFVDDPLRVLKGVRHAAAFGWQIEPPTAYLMREAASQLFMIAPERVRAEVAAIFSVPGLPSGINLLDHLGLLPNLFGPAGREDGTQEGRRGVTAIDGVLAAAGEAVVGLLSEEFEAGFSRVALLRLAAFVRGWHPHRVADPAERLRLGRRTSMVLRHLLQLSPARYPEVEALPALPRARALWADSCGGSVPDTLLFLATLAEAPPAVAFGRLLPALHDWLALQRNGRIPDLVDGHWLAEQFGLQGPAIGQAMAAVRQEEIAGRVRSLEEARHFLQRENTR